MRASVVVLQVMTFNCKHLFGSGWNLLWYEHVSSTEMKQSRQTYYSKELSTIVLSRNTLLITLQTYIKQTGGQLYCHNRKSLQKNQHVLLGHNAWIYHFLFNSFQELQNQPVQCKECIQPVKPYIYLCTNSKSQVFDCFPGSKFRL